MKRVDEVFLVQNRIIVGDETKFFARAVWMSPEWAALLRAVAASRRYSLKALHRSMEVAEGVWDMRDRGEIPLGYVDLCGLKPNDTISLCNFYSSRTDPKFTQVTVKSIAPSGWSDRGGGWFMDDNPDIKDLTLEEKYRAGLYRTYRIVLTKADGRRTLITAGLGAPVVYRGWR